MLKFDLRRVGLLFVAVGLGVIGILFYFADKVPDATRTDAHQSATQSASDPGGDNQDHSSAITDIGASAKGQSVTPPPKPPLDFADIAIDENAFGADVPLQIGPWLDADDPDAFDPDAELVEPMHMGEPVDADDLSTVTASTTLSLLWSCVMLAVACQLSALWYSPKTFTEVVSKWKCLAVNAN